MITLQHSTEVNMSSVFRYVELLFHNDGAVRKEAREHLVRIGKPAIPYVLPLLSHPHDHVRWEACKVLEKIRDPNTATVLAEMLNDDNMDVRWVAADALIALEHHAIIPLLEYIECHFEAALFRESAHHVLHELHRHGYLDEYADEVLNTLKVHELPTKAAFAAIKALDYYRSAKGPDPRICPAHR